MGGMIAFIALSIWQIESISYVPAPPQKIERRKDIFWKSQKEAVENNDETCYETVSFITPLRYCIVIIGRFPCLLFL